jgi:glyoxylase-like metal-dependent hydrolase (beta-lactamase superfamily II)
MVVAAVSCAPALAQQASSARALLESAAGAMGGIERLRGLDNLVMTGFGQRYASNGNISTDPNSPPKWQAVVDARRTFDLVNKRALNQERDSYMFPFAAPFGTQWNRRSTVQTGAALLDHPLPAVLAALEPNTELGPVRIEDGRPVVELTTEDGTTIWIALDPQTHLPYWTRWITGSATLGDVTHTAYFTGYLPVDGVWLPAGLMEKIDWRDQATLMFQVDSYRLDVDDMPEFPDSSGASPAAGRGGEPQVRVNRVTDGVWDLDAGGGSGGAVIEFEDHLVMFEPYGSEAQTFARIDAADRLVRGKRVTAVIVSHHHADHAAGVRAAVSRGLTIIAQRRNEALFKEWVSRPAVHFPDALARNPQPLRFMPVDEHLVLEDPTRRLDVYHAVGDFHMSDAVLAYLPNEKIIMEGDFTDESWEWNWWAYALRANIEHYGLDPEIDIPVHGTVGTIDEKLARTDAQVRAAQQFCTDSAGRGVYPFGCPVQYSTSGPVDE